MARSLAAAIGADPEEAAARVGGYVPLAGVEAAVVRRRRTVAALAIGLLALVTIFGIWQGVSTGRLPSEPVDDPTVVHRPDRLGRLLAGPEG
jgi:hypothetical protein